MGNDDRMTTIGATFTPFYPPERLPAVARAAEVAGLEELWLWEDCFREGGVSTMAVALALTERLRVGIGILPVPLRNVAITAMEVATLERMFPGRPIIGVGHGVLSWMGQIGARVESPMTLLREYVDALRALLRGETLTISGRYLSLDDVALDFPPTTALRIHAAAERPKTLRLSGEIADGTVLTGGTTPEQVREAVRIIDEGRAAAGRTDTHSVVVYLAVATGPDGPARLAAQLDYFGMEEMFAIAGDEQAIAEVVNTLAKAGATSVILQPPRDEPDPEGFVTFVAEKVRPLVA